MNRSKSSASFANFPPPACRDDMPGRSLKAIYKLARPRRMAMAY